MYETKHFKIHELVDPTTYDKYGDFAFHFLDDRLLILADFLRDKFGSCTVNDYHWGGAYKESGLRSPATGIGASYSQHKFGRALDMKFKEHTAEDVRQWLRTHWTVGYSVEKLGMPISITIENDVSWLHIDVRNNKNILNEFNP